MLWVVPTTKHHLPEFSDRTNSAHKKRSCCGFHESVERSAFRTQKAAIRCHRTRAMSSCWIRRCQVSTGVFWRLRAEHIPVCDAKACRFAEGKLQGTASWRRFPWSGMASIRRPLVVQTPIADGTDPLLAARASDSPLPVAAGLEHNGLRTLQCDCSRCS